MGRSPTGLGKECEEKGEAERSCYKPTTDPCSLSPVHCSVWGGGTGAGKERVKFLGLGQKGLWREDVLVFVFVSYHPNLLAINYFSLSQVYFACNTTWQRSLHLNPFNHIFSPVLLKRGSERAARWASVRWPRSTHHNFILTADQPVKKSNQAFYQGSFICISKHDCQASLCSPVSQHHSS